MKLILPFHVVLPRKKQDKIWILNLNSYRNTHFQILNQAKIAWKEIVYHAVAVAGATLDAVPPYHFTYTAFPATNRKFDLANVLPIVQKFTDDALIEMGIIPDDSYKFINSIDYRFGGVDKDRPRVELEIR